MLTSIYAIVLPTMPSASSMPSLSRLIVCIDDTSTPSCTTVRATCAVIPVSTVWAPSSRTAAVVLRRWSATRVSTTGTPAMSMMAARVRLDDVQEDALHDLVRAVAVDGSDQRQEEHAVVDTDNRRRQLADGGLVTTERVEVRRDIRIDGQRDVEEDDALHRQERRDRLGRIPDLGVEPLVDELEMLPVRPQVPLGWHADPFVCRADAEAILDVRGVAAPREEPDEIGALRALDAPDRGFVQELPRLGMREQEPVEVFDDRGGDSVGERAERGEPRKVLVGEREERAPARRRKPLRHRAVRALVSTTTALRLG